MAFFMVIISCKEENKKTDSSENIATEPKGVDNIAYQWSEAVIEGTALDTDRFKPRPTITSRYIGLIWVSIFDAWSRYDDKAIPVYLDEV